MEKVLDAYCAPYDPEIPLICMDEKPYQFLGEVMEPLPMRPKYTKRTDYEYIRNGTCSIFLFCEPHTGWANTSVRERRTKLDWAEEVHDLLTIHYPNAKKVRLVLDNLNTHTEGALYEKYPPKTARALLDRLEIIYTPKHGSWLNIAEIFLSMLERQCLKRRMATIEILQHELVAWSNSHNKTQKKIDWQFTTPDARIKLKRLYPVIA